MSARNCEHDTMFGERPSSPCCPRSAQTFPVGTSADFVDATRPLKDDFRRAKHQVARASDECAVGADRNIGLAVEHVLYSTELYASVMEYAVQL